ncbi:MAG: enoyl-CoA hydratase/isomerase family protein [Phycisphaeraceae bacterium]|nr:enoyl-CoA hydratase/isomerase family protein [Phycisphaeraceae bacterium]
MPPLPIRRHADGPCPGAISIVLEQPGKPVVVLDLELIQRIESTLRLVPRDAAGLILESASERVFVAGADLRSIRELSDDQLERYLAYGSKVFGMLSACPFPTVAAINGAALGGGLEIAMHCDALIACKPPMRDGQPGKPYPVGLPESGLSICPGWGGASLLPALMDPAEAIRRTATGTPLTFDEAVNHNLFSEVADDRHDLEETCLEWLARNRGSTPPRDGPPLRWAGRPATRSAVLAALDSIRPDLPDTPSARAVAAAVDTGLSGGWQAALSSEQRSLVHLRHTPEAIKAIDGFFAKSAGPKA